MTKGLDSNRLAITQGFDKMDEVKLSDLKQLPGFEAIEHPEMKETFKPAIEGKEITYKISNRDLNKLAGYNYFNETDEAFYNKKQYDDLLEKYDDLLKKKYSIIENYLSPDLIKLELVTKEDNQRAL